MKVINYCRFCIQDQEEIPEHDFQVGWKLEALHPETRTQICPATVIDVIDKYWFTVAFDDMTAECNADRVQFCANAASQEIFPQQWCMYKGIKLTPPPGECVMNPSWRGDGSGRETVAVLLPGFAINW